MTELEFHFHTGVEFSAPVSGHTFALHCLPVEDDAQKLQSYTVRIEPAAEYGLHRDGFGGWYAAAAGNRTRAFAAIPTASCGWTDAHRQSR